MALQRVPPVLIAASIVVVVLLCIQTTSAMECSRRTLMGSIERFQCPGLFEKSSKAYCCGTEMNRYCCKLSKAREHGYRPPTYNVDGSKVVKSVMTILLVVLLIIGACIGLCCFFVCTMLKKRRANNGAVLGGDLGTNVVGGQSVHMVNNPNASYPTQAPQPSYPQYPTGGGGGAPAYPAYPSAGGVQPPPYPTAYPAQPPFNPGYPQ